MTDSMVIQAECDSLREQLRISNSRLEEFERASTDFPPNESPTQPEPVSDALTIAWAQARNASTLLDTVIEHLRGKANGLEVSVTQLNTYHEEVMESLESINTMLREHSKILRDINHTVSIAVNEGRNNSERISLLELGRTLPTLPNRIGMG